MADTPQPYAISLVLHQGERPGWRVHVSPGDWDGGFPVSIKQAEAIAISATEVTDPSAPTTPLMTVRNGSTLMKHALTQQLAEAEAKAASIAGLRSVLAEIDN